MWGFVVHLIVIIKADSVCVCGWQSKGDIRDAVLMGVSLATLVYFAMNLYRVYVSFT